jgi:hypothetical protein
MHEEAVKVREEKELSECTYKPKINRGGAPIYVKRIAEQYQRYKRDGSGSIYSSLDNSSQEY